MGSRSLVLTAALLLIVIAELLAGCGSSAKRDAARANCRPLKMNEYGAEVVDRLYAQGKLGSRRLVESELGADSLNNGFGRTFFDSHGALRTYADLSPTQRVVFNGWMYGDRIETATNLNEKIARQIPRIDRECSSS